MRALHYAIGLAGSCLLTVAVFGTRQLLGCVIGYVLGLCALALLGRL